MNSVPDRGLGCDLNPGPTAPETSTLTTQLPSHVDFISSISISSFSSWNINSKHTMLSVSVHTLETTGRSVQSFCRAHSRNQQID